MVTNDLIIGMASGYTAQDLEPFCVSLQQTGYRGKCVLIMGDGPKDDVPRYGQIQDLSENKREQLLKGIDIWAVAPFDEHPSIARADFISKFLKDLDFRFVICTDTKDVVFQYDPTIWLEHRIGEKEIVVVSEMQRYGDGPMVGNNKNMEEAFGVEAYRSLLGQEVVNGGIIAGRSSAIRALEGEVYQMCLGDHRRTDTFKPSYADMLPDQSALNRLVRNYFWKDRVLITHPQDGFAFGHPLTRYSDFKDSDMYPTGQAMPYAIFHQYFDRVEWWKAVRERYKA